MKLESKEKVLIENLLKLIRRMKLDGFVGEEALALTEAYKWLASKLKDPEPPKPQPPVPTQVQVVEPGKVADIKDAKGKPKK